MLTENKTQSCKKVVRKQRTFFIAASNLFPKPLSQLVFFNTTLPQCEATCHCKQFSALPHTNERVCAISHIYSRIFFIFYYNLQRATLVRNNTQPAATSFYRL